MSIHPSLKISDKDKKQRSILKRIERIKLMIDKQQWKEGDEVFGLPKIKTLKMIRIKKEKAEKTETTAAPGAAPTAAPTAKEQASSKAPAAKAQEKK
jgi:small basic protein (TIGR04137 family)